MKENIIVCKLSRFKDFIKTLDGSHVNDVVCNHKCQQSLHSIARIKAVYKVLFLFYLQSKHTKKWQ